MSQSILSPFVLKAVQESINDILHAKYKASEYFHAIERKTVNKAKTDN